MRLSRGRFLCPDVFGSIELSFEEEEGVTRPLTLLFGGPGTGKTTLLTALLHTRPGCVVSASARPGDAMCYSQCLWWLGMDEPDRRGPLTLSTHNAPLEFATQTPVQRTEMAFVERLSKDGGFVFVAFSAVRWFSRSSVLLTSIAHTVRKHDIRLMDPMDDAGRHDMTREVKQALAFAELQRLVPPLPSQKRDPFGEAMRQTVEHMCRLYRTEYLGIDPETLEPSFSTGQRPYVTFDELPTCLKHALAFCVVPLRRIWAAYPDLDPRRGQAVVVIDQVELHQDPSTAVALVDALLALFPEVQWIVTTRSSELLAARSPDEVIALRRAEPDELVTVNLGNAARVH
jgi:hypothetical protein